MIGEEHKRLSEPFREHGSNWVECLDCGAQWALDEGGEPEDQVSAGGGSCLDAFLEEAYEHGERKLGRS